MNNSNVTIIRFTIVELVPYAFDNKLHFFLYLILLCRKLETSSLLWTFIITVENLREILQIIEFLENNHVARFFIFENKHRLRIFRPRKPVSGHGEGGTGFVIRRNARRGLWHPNPVKDDTYVYWSERFF